MIILIILLLALLTVAWFGFVRLYNKERYVNSRTLASLTILLIIILIPIVLALVPILLIIGLIILLVSIVVCMIGFSIYGIYAFITRR